MQITPAPIRLIFICTLSLCLSGCLLAAQGNHGQVVVAEAPSPVATGYKPGPPPHAKAYGHRAQHRYLYYPDDSVYFDTARSVYFYLSSNGTWRMSVSLPQNLSVNFGNSVTIEMGSDRPYLEYREHRKKYPPHKQKHHKWK